MLYKIGLKYSMAKRNCYKAFDAFVPSKTKLSFIFILCAYILKKYLDIQLKMGKQNSEI